MEHSTFAVRITATRGDGEAAGGLVRARVDGTGRLVGLVLAPEVMGWPAGALAEEVLTAAARAHDAAGEQLVAAAEQVRTGQLATDPVGRLAVDLADATRVADQRLDELATVAHDMLRQYRS